MRTAQFIVVAALCLADLVAALRWLRVAQREHYLAGSTTRFAVRWWRSGLTESLWFLIAIAALVTGLRIPLIALVTALVAIVMPYELSLRGRTSKLNWTRRLKTVGAGYLVLAGVIIFICASHRGLDGGIISAGAIALLSPILVDYVLVVFAPVEKMWAMKYVRSAKERLQRVHPKVVAITGSYGKTSTKGYVAHLLGGQMHVVASPQSYNNQAGLTKTVNELLQPGTDVLVAEMGAYGKGEIAALCEWLPPNIAVITAIGPVHLERFKTLANTLGAKSEITVGADVVVLNVDDELLAGFANELRTQGREVIYCSTHNVDADVVLSPVGNEVDVTIGNKHVGPFHLDEMAGVALTNVACAIGVAVALSCRAEEIVERLSSLPVAEHRLEARSAESGALILDDTFNSNPAGTRLALSRLSHIASPEKRVVVVTPGMVELGPVQFAENAAFAEEVGKVATDLLIVGRTNRRALQFGASFSKDSGLSVREVVNREEAVAYVASECGPGDVILYENDLPDHFP